MKEAINKQTHILNLHENPRVGKSQTKYVSGYIVKSGGWEGSGKIVNGCDFFFFFEIDEVMKFLKLKVMMMV